MPARVETTEVEGIDYTWIMQVTFVVTILVGAPLVTLLSIPYTLPTWAARASFAIRVGAIVWLFTALSVYAYARRNAST